LPAAAERPCAVERMRVGKASLGMMKVVVLAPQFEKKYVSP
jgi:hypothetical protein